MGDTLPRWRWDALYSGLADPAYEAATRDLALQAEALEELAKGDIGSGWVRGFIEAYNRVGDLFDELYNFAYGHYSTDTTDSHAARCINRLEELQLPLKRALVAFRQRLISLKDRAWEQHQDYAFFIQEQLKLAAKQMSPEEEDLAADLSRAGADAWQRLQEAVSSTLEMPWEAEESKTVTELRSLAFHRDRDVRRKAYELELEAWKSVEVPLAASLNGVKGFSVTLNSRRHYDSTLDRSLLQSRINREVLDALIQAMRESLPDFRRYLKTKAKLLGIDALSFYDIFAPVGKSSRVWSFSEARSFILDQFEGYSEELGAFGSRAFEEGWIDAEPRSGKVGGAYCMDLPLSGQSRILCNFDGSFSSVTTLAHELGHGYHHHVLKDLSHIHRDYPMPLAETASIFAENLVFDRAISLFDEQDRLSILEVSLSDATQIIVDILSRFIFESNLLTQRESHELSPAELNEMMLQGQRETYGEALEKELLHPYMWAVKSHYYSSDLAFYNFPYAFGLLFGLALLAIYRQEGDAFRERYRQILIMTGKASAIEVTAAAGFDIRKIEFWRQGLRRVRERIDEFAAAADHSGMPS